jgi:transketolase
MYAAGKRIDNLISTIDYNGRQIDGDVDDVLPLGSLENKWKAFGWKTMSCDGNNIEELINTLNNAKTQTGNGYPIMIIMKTEMGAGVDYMMGSHKWHGVAPNDEQLETALNQLEETIGDY